MFKKIDEAFVCEKCGFNVPELKYTCRDHCPKCLYSKHLDITPGDRAEFCHGFLKPIGIENNSKKGYSILYVCEKCGANKKNKLADDDDFDLLLEIVKKYNYGGSE